MSLSDKIRHIYSSLTDNDFKLSIVLQNDGDGDYIAKWEHPDYPQPTEEQLAGIE